MFIPDRVIFEKDAFQYKKAVELFDYFRSKGIEIISLSSNRVQGIPGDSPAEKYAEGKRTLVIGVRKTLKFQTCKPSAHFQLPLVSGCVGQCEYCYLNTQLGDKPYIRAYVNIEEILAQADKYIKERRDDITIFEGSATSDPLPVEPYTKGLTKAIEFFAERPNARFRFVTKFSNVEDFIDAEHRGNTSVRFSLNIDEVINNYEHKTPSARKRIEAAAKVIEKGYPTGFLIAPVFLEEDWKKEYDALLKMLKDNICHISNKDISFEIISHRFTAKAKNKILQVFPGTTLPMNEGNRSYRFGQFGYGKYIYNKEQIEDMKEFFQKAIRNYFPESRILYII
ncbi:spore photoproduct lyase [Lutispora thermophila]|uniref:Spore photoproduct lyase n=1 Tax=Lutispora thermophila DSM 19022 TaxID=1122184 RepID=A0A1M6DKV2_9FIRM|nr:spore photoproduct lyase [Lutispora thermophila]SHI73659.1 spore photoproduct lyase [Lutispora thermophila DSM 19022]